MAKYLLTQNERSRMAKLLEEATEVVILEITAKRPDWEQEILVQSRKRAVGQLKIETPLLKLEKMNQQIADLEEQRDALEASIREKMPTKQSTRTVYRNGASAEEEDYSSCAPKMEVCEAVNKLAARSRNAAMLAHPIGRRVHEIRSRLLKQLAELEKCSTREEVDQRKVLDFKP